MANWKIGETFNDKKYDGGEMEDEVRGTTGKRKSKGGTKMGLRLMLANVRSIMNKKIDFSNKVTKIDPHFVVVTESHLEEGILNSELGLNEYEIHRRDRNRKGGGVFVAIKKWF